LAAGRPNPDYYPSRALLALIDMKLLAALTTLAESGVNEHAQAAE
jgi:hypothetical protein